MKQVLVGIVIKRTVTFLDYLRKVSGHLLFFDLYTFQIH